jgi:hypothetical protein
MVHSHTNPKGIHAFVALPPWLATYCRFTGRRYYCGLGCTTHAGMKAVCMAAGQEEGQGSEVRRGTSPMVTSNSPSDCKTNAAMLGRVDLRSDQARNP